METRYVTNETGERVGVILSIEEYERLVEVLEDFEDIRAAQETLEAIERGEDALIPIEEALEEMRRNRKVQGL